MTVKIIALMTAMVMGAIPFSSKNSILSSEFLSARSGAPFSSSTNAERLKNPVSEPLIDRQGFTIQGEYGPCSLTIIDSRKALTAFHCSSGQWTTSTFIRSLEGRIIGQPVVFGDSQPSSSTQDIIHIELIPGIVDPSVVPEICRQCNILLGDELLFYGMRGVKKGTAISGETKRGVVNLGFPSKNALLEVDYMIASESTSGGDSGAPVFNANSELVGVVIGGIIGVSSWFTPIQSALDMTGASPPL